MGRLMLVAALLAATLRPCGGPTVIDAKIASVLPSTDEDRWLQVPWRTDLTAARIEAQRAGKPVFVWLMDGNPLGCT